MADIIDDYLRELESNLQVGAERKRQIVNELRTHLREKVYELQAADPARSQEDVARQVIADFGNPHDLALQYDAEGPVLKRATTGEVVLRFGRAVGRGTKAFLKGVGVTLLALLVVATLAGAWAYYEFKPLVAANAPYPVFEAREYCADAPCTAGPADARFHVHADAREIRFSLSVDGQEHERIGQELRRLNASERGSVFVRVLDPSGVVLYNRTFDMRASPDVSQQLTWASAPGNWTAEVGFDGFRGTVRLDVYTIGLPRDAGLPALRDVF